MGRGCSVASAVLVEPSGHSARNYTPRPVFYSHSAYCLHQKTRRHAMKLARWDPRLMLGLGVLALACGGDGGGGTGPCTPGVATQLVKSGDAQIWYVNNPLPAPLSVTARDANNCPVPGVVVNWAVGSGGGGVNPAQSTTSAAGRRGSRRPRQQVQSHKCRGANRWRGDLDQDGLELA